ncbi:MAG: 4-alpha-glucanotransferase [Actinomycetes bacterium]
MTSDAAERDDRPIEPELAELAELYGVATDFWDWRGRHTPVPRGSVVAVLRALGAEIETPEQVRHTLAEARLAPWRRTLPPCVVTRESREVTLPVHVPDGASVTVVVRLEGGDVRPLTQAQVWVEPREVDGRLVGEATFVVPSGLPVGWHEVVASVDGVDVGGVDVEAGDAAPAVLVVTPDVAELPGPLADRSSAPVWGLMAQLYQVRSRRSWGLGDLQDLGDLAAWAGKELGAGFVLVNPLHAAEPVGRMEPSPYLPTTRRFVNPIYISVGDIPEVAGLPAAHRRRLEQLAAPLQQLTATTADLDRDAVWAAKREALELVHAVRRSPERQEAYEAFCRREGEGLADFATWCALAESNGANEEWPAELSSPQAPAVQEARKRLADRVDFYQWLQWVVDEQLSRAQNRAQEAGMPLGVVHDLAVGVHPTGADTWALQDVLASGVTVGAPPDAFNQQGQDWSQPPWRPDRLAETGYAPYRDMLRTVLRHAGGIRVDHVVGLFRLWWVPAGRPASEGTYVRYDHEALVGILALEAARAGAVVVGEDLGTVEPWARDYLRERGLLGTSVLWFERDGEGRPLSPDRWRELCLATVTTHDLPPTAGYLAGEHVELRANLGLLERSVEEEREVDAREREDWLRLLREQGLLDDGAGEEQTVAALHAMLRRAPSRMLGVSLADLVGEHRTVNQPGTNNEYPNWRVALADENGEAVVLDDLVAAPSARVRAVARALGVTVPSGESPDGGSR